MSLVPSRLLAVAVALSLVLTSLPLAGLVQALNLAPSGNSTRETQVPAGWTADIPAQEPRPAPQEKPWWETTLRDTDRNGIVDWLDQLERPFPVGVSYERSTNKEDERALKEMGYSIKARLGDALLIGEVEPEEHVRLLELPGVVMIEPYGRLVYYGDVQTAATKTRNSTDYPVGAWDLGVTGKGVNIAVIDTGIDDGHPGLQGKFVAGYDAVCTDDDICMLTVGQGSGDYGQLRQQDDGSFNPDDKNQHGTACSGMATATGYDPNGPDLDGTYMGAAPDTLLVDVRIGTAVGGGPFENYILAQEFYESAMNGLSWIIDHRDTEWGSVEEANFGIDIISLSWGITSHEVTENDERGVSGSDGTDMHSRRLDEATEAGLVVSVAAGNDGPDNDGFSGMGSSSLSITIGSTNDMNTVIRGDDGISSYSSRGPRRDNGDDYPYDELKPDVSTPGQNIIQTEACTNALPGMQCDAEDETYTPRGSGTSYATPQAAGIMALLLEVNPDFTPAHIKEILRYTSERRGPATFPELDPFWNRDFGWGMLDGLEAVKLAQMLDEEYVENMDVELQAHVMEENLSAYEQGERTVKGEAWARMGTIDKIEVSLDGQDWWEVNYEAPPEGAATGQFIRWQVDLPQYKIKQSGDQVLWVRAVSGESYSLPDTVEFNALAHEDSGSDSKLSLFLAILGALVLGGIIGFATWTDRKEDEVISEVLEAEQ